jgi:hypothetical protein
MEHMVGVPFSLMVRPCRYPTSNPDSASKLQIPRAPTSRQDIAHLQALLSAPAQGTRHPSASRLLHALQIPAIVKERIKKQIMSSSAGST